MRIQPQKIMCAIDFSDYTDMVLQYGKALSMEFGSKLYLCHVVSSAYMVSGHMTPLVDYTSIETERIHQTRERLEKMAQELDLDCDIRVELGNPAEAISELALENQIDMVVAATYGGSGVKRFLIGSVTDRLVKILSCPLLVLHPQENRPASSLQSGIHLKKILVGCDFSPDSELAFEYALSLAQEFQTQLYLAHVIPHMEKAEASYSDYLDLQTEVSTKDQAKKAELFTHLQKKLLLMVPSESHLWCTPKAVILDGHPYKELIEYADHKDVDMIVLGIRGHGLMETFLVGSTTDRVISRANCPVLAIRQLAEPEKSGEQPETENKELTTGILAKDIMEKKVITITPDTDIITAVKILLKHRINGLPVIDSKGSLKGLLCQSDLIYQQKELQIPPVFSMLDSFIPLASSRQLEQQMEKISALTVDQAMVKDPTTAHPDMPIAKIASLMVEKHFHTIPVIDSEKLVGVIGQEDILKVLIPDDE